MNATLIDARVQWSVSTAPRSTSSLLPTYMFPSENGQRGDVHWLSVRSASGEGLHVSGSSTFGFSASRHSLEALERAKHPHELKPTPACTSASATSRWASEVTRHGRDSSYQERTSCSLARTDGRCACVRLAPSRQRRLMAPACPQTCASNWLS